jgi:hypothetical protein
MVVMGGGCFVDCFDDEWGCVAESSFGGILAEARKGGVAWSLRGGVVETTIDSGGV